MTICIATDNYYPSIGGISTFYKNLAGLLLDSGHSVVVLTVDYDAQPDLPDNVITEGNLTRVYLRKTFFDLYHEWKPYFRPGGLECYNWIAMGLAMRSWLFSNHKNYCIDIIEAVDYGGIAFFLYDEELPPVVITAHGSLNQLSRFNSVPNDTHFKVITKLERESFVNVDAIIAHSALNQQDLTQWIGREVHLALIPWQLKRQNIEAENDTHTIVVVGGLSVVKGATVMAEAMLQLFKEKHAAKVVWIGGDTYTAPQQTLVSAYIQQMYPDIWQDNFIWKGEQTNETAQKELAKARIVVLPSVWETFNQVTLEAAAMGKAIIISDKVGAAYLFNHKQNAYIIPSNDHAALATAIAELYSNDKLCNQIGLNAMSLVKTLFSDRTSIEERLSIYKSVISNRNYDKKTFEQRSLFLKSFRKGYRRRYYKIRSYLKKLTKGNVAF